MRHYEASNENCVVSVAFREPYLSHSYKQDNYIMKDYPALCTSVIFFWDELPAKDCIYDKDIVSHFQKSLYGFKPHAIQRAIDAGYKKIIWLDPSVLPTVSMQVLIDALDDHPIIVRSGEEPLSKMCNAKAKRYFDVTDEDIKNERTVAGTIYGFNFNTPIANYVFSDWKTSEEHGIFGTQDDFMAGHWADEAVMALCLYKCNVPQYFPIEFTYLNQKEL